MSLTIMLYGVLFITGVLFNVFIEKMAIFLFKKDGTVSRFPIRFLGIYLIINSISHIFHI
ncbi:MAG: hypothetical protein K0R23_2141 [Lacrimispora sp.]|jgi:hypothetical protein|nr:hypothetical protein [Lacrimispora sp.]